MSVELEVLRNKNKTSWVTVLKTVGGCAFLGYSSAAALPQLQKVLGMLPPEAKNNWNTNQIVFGVLVVLLCGVLLLPSFQREREQSSFRLKFEGDALWATNSRTSPFKKIGNRNLLHRFRIEQIVATDANKPNHFVEIVDENFFRVKRIGPMSRDSAHAIREWFLANGIAE